MRAALLVAVLTSGVVIAGCGGMRGMHSAPDGVVGTLDEMPVSEFYRVNCAGCHGNDRQGGVGPALLPSTLVESDAFYVDVIAFGRPGTAMPSWVALGLTDEQMGALMAFLRTEP